jgi:inorganic pyrophosphatase
MNPQTNPQNLYFLESGTADKFNVIIEIPYGSQNKYELDPQTGALFLDRVLFSSEFYPFNYGFIPSTKAEDGDALDVAVLLTNPVPAGCVLRARAIGMLKKIDSGDQDNCVIGVPCDDPRFKDVVSLDQLPKHKLDEIADFFQCYKRLQGKTTEIQGFIGADQAKEEVSKYLNNYTSYQKKD